MAQFALLNNGIRVRDPSQMFMFADTNWVHGFSNQSAGLLTKNKSQQAGVFSNPLTGNQSSGSVDQDLSSKEDKHPNAVIEASSSDENQPCFGLTPITQSQTPGVNNFDPFKMGQQMVKKEDAHFKKPSQIPISVSNHLISVKKESGQRRSTSHHHVTKSHLISFKKEDGQRWSTSNHHITKSHLISVKKEDGQRWSTGPGNIMLDSPVQQNPSVTGSCDLPSSSCVSKKRNRSTFECLPWHKEVTEASSWLHDISPAEPERAHSVVWLPKNVNKLAEKVEGPRWIINPKRRLSLTTELMQLLFQPPPYIVLSEDAITHCDVVTYYASKLALDGACSLCSPAGKNITPKSSSNQDLLKVVEGFIDRSKRLQDDMLRLEKRDSLILKVVMDFQDLERFSFINRFAKFHTRRPMVRGDTPSSSMPKLCPEKPFKAIPMPNMVPEGRNCLFL